MEFLCKFHPLHLSATPESNHPEWGSPVGFCEGLYLKLGLSVCWENI